MIGGVSTPSSSAADTSLLRTPGGSLGKDEFLQLLVAQLRNQDPLSPMKGEEFAAQLAQFSSVEQLMGIHDQLKAQGDLQEASIRSTSAASALEMVGKDVLAAGNRLAVGEGLPTGLTVGSAGRGEGTLRILDSTGQEVAIGPAGPIVQGRNEIDAVGIVADLPPGTYTYELTVTDAAGNAVEVQNFVRASIEAVRFGPQGPVLLSTDGLEIPLSSVVEMRRSETEEV